MPRKAEDAPPTPGGRAAERREEFLRQRLPAGASPEDLNPEFREKSKPNNRSPKRRKAKQEDQLDQNGDKPGNP
jgi:hypothetical protein